MGDTQAKERPEHGQTNELFKCGSAAAATSAWMASGAGRTSYSIVWLKHGF